MNHKVQSVQNLYEDAVQLFDKGVSGSDESSADNIINALNLSIDILKSNWEGKDAGVQINKIVNVCNGMIEIRNALVELASDSTKIAANYREIQNANGAGLDRLEPLPADLKNTLPEYVDTRDTINISTEANEGKAKIDSTNDVLDSFISNCRMYYDRIMENWVVGAGREKAMNAFESFMTKSGQYRQTLAEVSESITKAIQNYNMQM